METHEGNSAPPIIKEFQIEGTWAPVTPIKPSVVHSRPIYEDGEAGVLSYAYMREFDDHMSRISHQSQAQTLLSCSISSAEKLSNNNPHINNNPLWGNHNNPSILERENVGIQKRGLEDYLPRWSSQGRRSTPPFGPENSAHQSNFPIFNNSWEILPSNTNGVRENVSVVDNTYDESLGQFNNMSFADLLSMKGSLLEPSIVSMRQGNSSSAARTTAFFQGGFDCGSTLANQDALNQQINGISRGGMQSGAFRHHERRFCDLNSPPSIKHARGKSSTFVPLTPDLRWRGESVLASGNTTPGTDRTPNKQNGLQEHEVAAAMVNLHNVNNEQVTEPLTDSSPDKVSAVVEDNQNPDKEGEEGIDLNKTPAHKKPRRRRYTPKVVREDKPKKTLKPKTPNPKDSTETPRVKRKYVRRNKTNPPSTPPPEEETEEVDPKATKRAAKSCKKSLNFDLNGSEDTESGFLNTSESQFPKDNAAGNQSSSHTVHVGQAEGLTVETSQVGIAYDVNRTVHQELKNYTSHPTIDAFESLLHKQCIPTGGNDKTTNILMGNNAEVSSRIDGGVQIMGSKRGHSSITDAMNANHRTVWQPSLALLGNGNIHGVPKILFPEICKKKRTEKGQRSHSSSISSAAPSEHFSQASSTTTHHPGVDPSASKFYYCNPGPFRGNSVGINQAEILMRNAQNRAHLLNTWADMARLKKKKRSKGTTRVRDLSALKGLASIAPDTPAVKCPQRMDVEILEKPYSCSMTYVSQSNSVNSCLEALTGDAHTTPRSKRGPRKPTFSRSSNIRKGNKRWDLVLYDINQSVRKKKGSIRWISTFSVEAISEGLKQLDINKEGSEITCQKQSAIVPYQINNEEQNALVLCKNDGTVVPYDGPFEPIRRGRQRAKVELDNETTRVWRLLLENIDNQGIDGTDEDKVKWWENERSVFRGRVDSFIARMRLVQGDRRFTPWKGSVLDSVIGVFLTQNVSDHLSSSAFMAMAARFPLKSERSESTPSEEASSTLIVEPEVFVEEPEESITWNEKHSDPQICESNSRIIHETDCGEEKEVVNSKDIPTDYSSEGSQKATNELRVNKASSPTTDTEGASTVGDDRARDDATSSQQSVISSQNSVNSSNFQTTSSQCYYFDPSTSFIGLLKMAESPFLHESYSQVPRQDRSDSQKHVTKDYLDAPSTSSSNYLPNLQVDYHLRASKYREMLEAESRSSDGSRKGDSSPVEQSNLTTESTGQHLPKEKAWDGIPRSLAENRSSCYVLEGEQMVKQSQGRSMKEPLDNVASSCEGKTCPIWKSPNFPKLSKETADVIESTTKSDRTKNYPKEVEQTSKHSRASADVSERANPNPTKPKTRAGKEKRNAFDWDSLRKEAEATVGKREKTANTMDSIDWEAVRLADVSEIADTIKARGMNNMLSQRIKELLDRLLREHGSIDLEWLRDIPPDKAKEYLLSFRGLGLKSVECVRLLTLHHLAFPVDTNVGRIAVRLGWVPLQPLPESLQLHLLEMYPVLESIQKYLWPRLCKLDQKTLYELHYHMITFGKVFCTKRQPNCNACPLRAECRHFASAFASARLALPGPEERSIMAPNGGSSSHIHPQDNINPLPLPAFWGNQQSGANSRCNTDGSIVEVASTPLSLPFSQTVQHLERTSVNKNCEPIVEVPASPEPEPEQEPTFCDIEDAFYEDPDEIPTIQLNMKEFSQTLENFMQANRELQEAEMTKALVALTPEAASIPTPKLKNISRLRTEHQVYELPDTHPLLKGWDRREPDDPCSYLLAIWTPGETANSIEPPARICSFEDPSILCNEATCCYCSSQREANSQIVRGTLLIPCRTAMRGCFPLNGTYFQVNEVFADHDSSLKPIDVPRSWLWNLPRRTVYFGTSIPTIFRGVNTEDIQHCFWRGYVCVRGFEQKTRSPRPLMARLHFPASRMQRGARGKAYRDDE